MTDFFTRQQQAKRRSVVLTLYFLAAVAATVVLVYLALVLLFTSTSRGKTTLWHPGLFYGSAIGTLVVVLSGCAFRILELSSGGGAVARSLGGRLVSPQTRDPLERRLLNVVEEMSLASGVPVPQVYVLDDEQGINAFAAGFSTRDAAVGVTRGCLQWLTRDELQGVIAHEFSHILNGDMRLNVRLIGVIAGIMGLATLGSILLRARGRGKGAGQVMLLGLALLAIGYIGALFGRMIQAAISRQREFLADASAVQFTRLPDGLAGALKKIGGLAAGSRVQSPRAEEAAHLFFSNGVSSSLSSLFATHPPLVERIRALDPAFDGVFRPPTRPADVEPAPPPAGKARPRPAIPKPPMIPVPAPQILGLAGATSPAHVVFAAELRRDLPEEIHAALNEPLGAVAVVCGLLLSRDPQVRERQWRILEQWGGAALVEETRRLAEAVTALPVTWRLAVVDKAAPALRELSPRQYENFLACLRDLIHCDQQVDLFEYALQKVVQRHLEPYFKGAKKRVVQYYSHRGLAAEIGLLLSALAHVGHKQPEAVQKAFATGVERLMEQGIYFPFFAWEHCHAEALDRALDACLTAAPGTRQRILQAMVATVTSDGVVQPAEAELLRAFADTLECPLPPFLGQTL